MILLKRNNEKRIQQSYYDGITKWKISKMFSIKIIIKISGPTGNDDFELPNWSYSVANIRD